MSDRYYMDIIGRKIEKKLNWGGKETWKDYEYKKLSHLIYESTAISISPQTLKRLFGKVKYKDDYTSQPATKDALARFLNYADWEAFVNNQTTDIHKVTYFLNKKWEKYLSLTLWTASAVCVAVLSVILIPKNHARKVKFFAENVSGVIPHTVSFHYDISKLKHKEVLIDFDQEEAESKLGPEVLDRHRNVINHCFETPGYFNVGISSNGKVLASVKIHALSDGWASYYFNDDNFTLRKFVFGLEKKIHNTVNDGLLYVSPKELNNQGFNGNTVFYLEHMLYRDFNTSADSCTLEVGYRNCPEMGGISCYDVEFRIIGENGIASVMLVQKGCYRWSEIRMGDKYLNGKYNNLLSLSTDLSCWNLLRIKIENLTFDITNGKDSIFKGSYLQPLGRIKGIRFATKGSGAFDWVRLQNSSGQVMYEDRFGK